MNPNNFFEGPFPEHLFCKELCEYLNNIGIYTFNQLIARLDEVTDLLQEYDPTLLTHMDQVLHRFHDIWEKADADENKILPPEIHRGTLLADLGISQILGYVLFRLQCITVGDLLDYEKGFTELFQKISDEERRNEFMELLNRIKQVNQLRNVSEN